MTGGNDSLLKVWKLWTKGKKVAQMESIKTLSGHGGSIMSVKFAQNGRIFVSTSGDKTLRMWHAANLVCLRVLEGHGRYVNCGVFNPEGDLLVTGSNDRSFNVWQLSGALCSSDTDLRPTSAVVSKFFLSITKY